MRLSNEVITVFNARYDPTTGYDTYEPTVIIGASWFCEIASNVDSTGLKAADKYTIRIPENAYFNDKTYLDPIDYAKNGDPTKNFTLQNGDIIVKDAIIIGQHTPADLKKNYTNCVTVLGVTDNRRAPNAPHWKIVGA